MAYENIGAYGDEFDNEYYSLKNGVLFIREARGRGPLFKQDLLDNINPAEVKTIVINEGIQRVGTGIMFSDKEPDIFPNLDYLYLPKSLLSYDNTLHPNVAYVVAPGNVNFFSYKGALYENDAYSIALHLNNATKLKALPKNTHEWFVPQNYQDVCDVGDKIAKLKKSSPNLERIISDSDTNLVILNNGEKLPDVSWRVNYKNSGKVVDYPLSEVLSSTLVDGSVVVLLIKKGKKGYMLGVGCESGNQIYTKNFPINQENHPMFFRNETDRGYTFDDLAAWAKYAAANNKKLPSNDYAMGGLSTFDIPYYYKNNNIANSESVISAWLDKLAAIEEKTKFKLGPNQIFEEKVALIELSQALGVFSEVGSESKQAADFIKEKVIPYYTRDNPLHSTYRFLDRPYSREFFNFVKKYFVVDGKLVNSITYSASNIPNGEYELTLGALHANWNMITNFYSNRSVNERSNFTRLGLDEVVALLAKNDIIESDPEFFKFCKVCNQSGMSRYIYPAAKQVFKLAKTIQPNITCAEDNKNETVDKELMSAKNPKQKRFTYELMKKDDESAVLLGKDSTSCMHFNGAGEGALIFGMLSKNAGFLKIHDSDYDIPFAAQAMIYYANKTLVLDNIEIPNKTYLPDFNKNPLMQKGMRIAIENFAKNAAASMKKHGFEVDYVTIGTGYNDAMPALQGYEIKKDNLVKPEDVADIEQYKQNYEQTIGEKYSGVYSDAKYSQVKFLDLTYERLKSDSKHDK